MQILKAGILYFALVFGSGFALGTVRVRPHLARLFPGGLCRSLRAASHACEPTRARPDQHDCQHRATDRAHARDQLVAAVPRAGLSLTAPGAAYPSPVRRLRLFCLPLQFGSNGGRLPGFDGDFSGPLSISCQFHRDVVPLGLKLCHAGRVTHRHSTERDQSSGWIRCEGHVL